MMRDFLFLYVDVAIFSCIINQFDGCVTFYYNNNCMKRIDVNDLRTCTIKSFYQVSMTNDYFLIKTLYV